MKLVDDHCHLDEFFYDQEEIAGAIMRAKAAGVKAIISAGITPDTNRHVMKLHERYPDMIYPALGLYPRDALKKDAENTSGKLIIDYDVDKELDYIYSHRDSIVAVGEVGMDFKEGDNHAQQEKDFRKVIMLAIKLDKPLVIHSRKAEERVIEILEEFNYKKIVMHCFGGNHNLVRRIREHQWMFSIPTSIVRDQHFQKIVKETGMNLILTETDAPFLSPFREKRNEPAFISETIKILSKIKNTPEEDIANMIFRNSQRLFQLA